MNKKLARRKFRSRFFLHLGEYHDKFKKDKHHSARNRILLTIVSAVEVLTHECHQPYFDYIAGIKKNKLAIMVKLADLKDNMNLSRITIPN